ncbi:P-loop containing nucleoside triphosphate hydrolase protein [Cladochytrium replicatum]|nr:P-loop containing nucleoside triphosphate hydrolase protein [Cladochytrium replicatum]
MPSLRIRLVSSKTCLVALPQAWLNLLWDNLKGENSTLPLELVWSHPTEDNRNAHKRAYVSWAGAAAANPQVQLNGPQADYIEIDTTFAAALGLADGQEVTLRLAKNVQPATTINVEPLTPDDWEILELHAEYLEGQFLSQIRVVSPGQTISIWIHHSTLIRLKLLSTDPETNTCVILNPDTEVIVAPNLRKKPNASSDRNASTLPSQPSSTPKCYTSRLLPASASINPTVPRIRACESDLAKLDHPTVAFVRKRSIEDTAAPADPVSNDLKPTGVYVFVDCSSRVEGEEGDEEVPNGHVRVPEWVGKQIRASRLSKLSLAAPSAPPVESFEVILHPDSNDKTPTKLSLKQEIAPTKPDLRVLFSEYLHQIAHNNRILLTSNTLIHLSASSDFPKTPYLLKLVSPAIEPQQPNAQPLYLLFEANEIHALVVKEGESMDLSAAVTATSANDEDDDADAASKLGGVAEVIDKVVKYLSARCLRSRSWKSLSVPSRCGMLLHGSAGTGKTAIARACVGIVSRDPSIYAFPIYVNCVQLSNERIPRVKESILRAIQEAAWHAPSILIFDDLDRLIPADQEHNDTPRSTHLADFLSEYLRLASTQHRMAILATSQSTTSLHTSLTSSHLFSETVHLTPPNAQQRRAILSAILGNDTDVSGVAMGTEGFAAADLVTLVKRAGHEAAMRAVREGPSGGWGVRTEDLEKARAGYVPASLRGVKLSSSEVSWAQIGGLREAKRTLLETLEWPTKYAAIFAKCPLRLRSGLLLYGYSGCGKTLLASAVAKECGLNFISVKGPELLNKYIGASEKSVRDLFERASAAKPCILFFDEFDAIAPRRGHDNTGVTDRVVNQLLTLMDGAEGLQGVYVLAATSRPDLIDPALLRPGRLDKSILCDMPDESERLEIMQAVSRSIDLDESIDLSKYAALTRDYSGADLQAIMYDAHLEAVHDVLNESENATTQVSTKATATKAIGGGGGRDFMVVEGVVGAGKKVKVVEMTLAERNEIMRMIQNLRPEASKLRKSTGTNGTGVVADHAPAESRKVIRVLPKHVEAAFKNTRASIPAHELARLRRVYDEFGSSGADGTSVAVGKRSTLA